MAIRKPNQPNRARKTEEIAGEGSPAAGRASKRSKGLASDHLDNEDTFRVGQILGGRFQLTKQIGAGAMGAVFEALDQHLGETICVKALAAPKFSEQMVEERLRRELLVSRKLNHPNICRAYDHLSEGSKRFLVMELVRGRTLRDVMRQDGRPSSSKACGLIETLLDALSAAHRAGVIHRDIKPDNIMLSDEGRLVLLDFGISLDREMSRLTAPGLVLGSKRFVAPELWRGQAPTPAVDVWAVGVIFFYLLTNTFPFSGNMVLSSVRDRVALDIPLLREVRPSASAAFEKVLYRMLAIDPAKRYQTAEEALAALRKANQQRIRSHLKARAIAAANPTNANGRASGSGERFFDIDDNALVNDDEGSADAATTKVNNAIFHDTLRVPRGRGRRTVTQGGAPAKTLVEPRRGARIQERPLAVRPRPLARAAMAFAAVLLFASNTEGEAHATESSAAVATADAGGNLTTSTAASSVKSAPKASPSKASRHVRVKSARVKHVAQKASKKSRVKRVKRSKRKRSKRNHSKS